MAKETTESKGGYFAKLKWFSTAKIIFLWKGLKFKRGHDPPTSSAYAPNICYPRISTALVATCIHLFSLPTINNHSVCINTHLIHYNQVHTLLVIAWFQLLLKHGASKDIKDQEGLTPLDISLQQHGDDSSVTKLLQQEGMYDQIAL